MSTSNAGQLLKDGLLAAKAGQDERAIQLLRKLTLVFADSDLADNAYYNLGILYKRQGKLAKAKVEFKTVLDNYPDSDAAQFARDEYEAVKEKDDPACDLFHLGQKFMIQREVGKARSTFETMLEKYPGSDLVDNAYLALAQIAKLEGNTATMIKLLDLIERDYPGSDAAALVPDLRKY